MIAMDQRLVLFVVVPPVIGGSYRRMRPRTFERVMTMTQRDRRLDPTGSPYPPAGGSCLGSRQRLRQRGFGLDVLDGHRPALRGPAFLLALALLPVTLAALRGRFEPSHADTRLSRVRHEAILPRAGSVQPTCCHV